MDPDASRCEEERPSPLAARVEELAGSLAALAARVAELEARAPLAPPAAAAAVSAAASEPAAAPAPPAPDLTRSLALVGRTLIVLGGGYLLRALTAAGVLGRGTGVVLAALYTLGWLLLADRAGARRAPAGAAFHGAAAVLLGLPLLWETTVRFHDLSPPAAALALAAFLAACLAVAWRRELHALAWLVALGAPPAALALLAGTRSPVPFGAGLVLLGGLGLLLDYGRGWRGLGWTLATTGQLAGLLVAFGALAQGRGLPAALAVCLALCLGYLAVLGVQLLWGGREIDVFAGVQTALAAAVGYGGAMALAPRSGPVAVWIAGGLGLLLAAACYAAAFRLVPREARGKLLLASTLALAFALGGSGLLLPPAGRALLWAALAPLLGWQALRRRRVTLGLHGASYALAAAAASGLLTAAAYAFVAPPATPWPPLRPAAFLALAAAAVLSALPLPRPAPFWEPYRALTRALQLTVLVWGAAGTALHFVVPAVAGAAGPGCDPAMLATVRTAALSAVAVLLGWISRRERFREARLLVYPTLLLAVLKLPFEDLPHGRPATLFVALALCGLAFIAAPRLARRAG